MSSFFDANPQAYQGPSPVVYADTVFPSRLEALWAVFLDEAGFRWTHRQDTHDLGIVAYTPAFELPDYQCFVSVLPRYNAHGVCGFAREVAKRVRDISDATVWVMVGTPSHVSSIAGFEVAYGKTAARGWPFNSKPRSLILEAAAIADLHKLNAEG